MPLTRGFPALESTAEDLPEPFANTDSTDDSASANSRSDAPSSFLVSTEVDNGTDEQTDSGNAEGGGVPSGVREQSAVSEHDGMGIGR